MKSAVDNLMSSICTSLACWHNKAHKVSDEGVDNSAGENVHIRGGHRPVMQSVRAQKMNYFPFLPS